MKSPITKYSIIALGILFVLSAAEISREEYEQYYNTENHFFVGTESVLLTLSTPSLVSLVHKFFPLTFVTTHPALLNAVHSVEVDEPPGSHPARQAVPLYLDISSLRI